MRLDENGNQCPATLGEYRDLCAALCGTDCKAVEILDENINKNGRDEPVYASDQQMRALLLPMLLVTNASPNRKHQD